MLTTPLSSVASDLSPGLLMSSSSPRLPTPLSPWSSTRYFFPSPPVISLPKMVQETSDVTSLGDEPGYVLFFSYQLFNTFYYEIFRRISAMTTTFHCPHVHHLRCPTRTSPIVNFTSMGQLQRDGYQDDDASTCGPFRVTMCAIAKCVVGFTHLDLLCRRLFLIT